METLFTARTKQLVKWEKIGLISRETAIIKFKELLAEKQGTYSLDATVKATMLNKLLKDRI